MVRGDVLAKKGRLLERNGGDFWIIGQVIALAHRFVLDKGTVSLKQASMIALEYVSAWF